MNVLAEENTCLVVYPAQALSANVSRCWNWFISSHQRRGHGEPSLVAGITRQVMHQYMIDRRRIYIAGLSAGGCRSRHIGQGISRSVRCRRSTFRSCAREHDHSRFRPPPHAAGPVCDSRCRQRIFRCGSLDHTDHSISRRSGHQSAPPQLRGCCEPIGCRNRAPKDAAAGSDAERTCIYANHLPRCEQMRIDGALDHHGLGHAWSGGSRAGSYTDPQGPDAAREMLQFFLQHSHASAVCSH